MGTAHHRTAADIAGEGSHGEERGQKMAVGDKAPYISRIAVEMLNHRLAEDGMSAGLRDLMRNRVPRLAFDIGDNDRTAPRRQQVNGTLANAGGATGDQATLPLKSIRRFSVFMQLHPAG